MSGTTTSLLWYVARGSGIVAFILLTLSVALGITMNRRWYSTNWPRMVVDAMHRWFTITFFSFTVIHVATIMLDPFAHVSLNERGDPVQRRVPAVLDEPGSYRDRAGSGDWCECLDTSLDRLSGVAHPAWVSLPDLWADTAAWTGNGNRHRHTVDGCGLWEQCGADRTGHYLATGADIPVADERRLGRRSRATCADRLAATRTSAARIESCLPHDRT